jgi:signal transduction histidine kinase
MLQARSREHVGVDQGSDRQVRPIVRSAGRFSSRRLSDWAPPARILLITTTGIFIAELVAMVVVYLLPDLPYVLQMLIDAAIMTALIFPVLYFLSFRELLNHIEHHRENEWQLQRVNRDLQALSQTEYEQRRWAEALAEATAALSKSLDLDEVLTRILTLIGRVTPYRAAGILLLDGEKVNLLRHRGFEQLPEAVTAYEEKGFAWDAFPSLSKVRDTGQPLLVADREVYPLRESVSGFEWVQSFMVAPFRHDKQVAGLIVLLSDERDFFDEADFERLISFTSHAEMAIGNARLFERETQARKLADVLHTASTALAQSLDLDVVARTSLEHLALLVPYDRADVALLESHDRLNIRASISSGTNGMVRQTPVIPFERDDFPLIKTLLKEQTCQLIADTAQDAGWCPFGVEEHARSWLGVPLTTGGKTIGFFSLEKAEPGFFREEHVRLAQTLAAQTAVTIQKAWLFEQVRTGSERLQSLSRRLVEIQETERNYIARELHDEAGQALAALSVDLRVLEQNSHCPEVILDRVAKMDASLQSTIKNLHRVAMALRPAALDHVGLEAALRQHAEEVAERHGLALQFDFSGLVNPLPNNVETILYRIVQEALTNIVRHAQATQVDVLLKKRGERVVVIVEDDGVGFDPYEALRGERLGLLGMRERAEMLNGQLTIESAPGKGTTIVVEIPYVHSDFDY